MIGMLSFNEVQKHFDLSDFYDIPYDTWPAYLYRYGKNVELLTLLEKWKNRPPSRLILNDFLATTKKGLYEKDFLADVILKVLRGKEVFKELVDLIIYFGADINEAKKLVDREFERHMLDQKIRKLIEIKHRKYYTNKAEKILIGEIEDVAIVDEEDMWTWVEEFNRNKEEIWEDFEGATSQCRLNYVNIDLRFWQDYFEKVEAGKKIAGFIKEQLDDEFEMKPLRTKIDMKKIMEIVSEH